MRRNKKWGGFQNDELFVCLVIMICPIEAMHVTMQITRTGHAMTVFVSDLLVWVQHQHNFAFKLLLLSLRLSWDYEVYQIVWLEVLIEDINFSN